ncbi:MAG: protein tyrosine phosphatase [Pseudomonadota bacterium]
MASTKRKRKPHIPADLTSAAGRNRAHSELIWSDHGFLRTRFSNLHEIFQGVWRSNQPSPSQIRAHVDDRGIRTIINLRGESTKGYYLLEKEACSAANVTLIDFQVFSRDTPTSAAVLGAEDLFRNIEYPVLMHCKSGADRAGLMATLYSIFVQGHSVSTSIEQLSLKYLHVKQGKTGMLDAFFQAAIDAGADSPDQFRHWVRTDYDRIQVKANFLKKQGRTLELDRLLGRE